MNIQTLAERFCAAPLPETVCADHCATVQSFPNRTGTNILTVTEAKAVLTHVAGDLLEKQDRYYAATMEMVEAYGEMEKGIDDEILCHYNGMRLHNAMEDLRVLVLPDYAPRYEPNVDEIPDPE